MIIVIVGCHHCQNAGDTRSRMQDDKHADRMRLRRKNVQSLAGDTRLYAAMKKEWEEKEHKQNDYYE